MRKASLLVVAAIALVIAPWASAHAEIKPEKVPASSVKTLVLSVEGERASPTTKVSVQVPAALADVKPPPTPGWQMSISGRVITWSGGTIGEGQFGKFRIAARFPNTPGSRLTFPTVQTYADGTVVRWIGPESSETPAPSVLLTATIQPPPPPPPPPTTQPAPPPPPPPVTTTTNDEDGVSTGWIVGAVVIVVLAGSAVALLWRRRRP